MRNKPTKEKRKGFTLIEMIIVLLLLAILLVIVIPALTGYIDEAKGMASIYNARLASEAAVSGLAMWRSSGSPGNSDKTFKKNIETEIINFLSLKGMKSYIESGSGNNSVQVALSLPSYYSQGWDTFVKDCTANGYRNFVRVWIEKNPDKTVGNTINGIYYVSADGKYASRIVFDDTTKLGAVGQRAGTYYERLD